MNYILTGAGSSLGRVLAQKIVAEDKNNKLILISRKPYECLKNLENDNVKYFSGIDLLKFESKIDIANFVNSFFTSSFALIHTAGNFWHHWKFLDKKTNSKFGRKMMDSHYGTLYAVLQVILPIMIKKGGGRILTFSCNATPYNFPQMLPFTAAKAAVEATMKCIAHEYSKYNIIANTLAISSLKTEATHVSKPHGDWNHYLSLEELSLTVIDILNIRGKLVNGSLINCFEYSDSYYGDSYLNRIKKDEDKEE